MYGQYLSSSEIDQLCAPSKRDVGTVMGWASEAGCAAVFNKGVVDVSCNQQQASRLLRTSFRFAYSPATNQSALVASAYSLPPAVDAVVAAVYGLHGLPLPPRKLPKKLGAAVGTATVTPQVLRSTYGVGDNKGSGNKKNRQAVAEFQGEAMNQTDLSDFFIAYVPSADPGDEQVYAYQGDPGKGPGYGTEAALDIQYIMGVAPKILTEFWYQKGNDFCSDVKIWAGKILADPDPPLVHSLSYGQQANLTEAGCSDEIVEDIDADLTKLAAKGMTIIVASGDRGSGYVPPGPDCAIANDTQLQGTILHERSVVNVEQCCEETFFIKAQGYTFQGTPAPACSSTSGIDGIVYQGTQERTFPNMPRNDCCGFGSEAGWSWVRDSKEKDIGTCVLWRTITGSTAQNGTFSGLSSAGQCQIFSAVTGKTTSKNVTSGGIYLFPGPKIPTLYPSWPASSPWVTAVGATRFVDQKVGQPEMASDEFGSGGGFSPMFSAFDAQAAATAKYLKSAPGLPPKGSYPPGGRGSADISALGENYQVVLRGQQQGVDGTSASTPAFAGLISLLNEHRLAAGQKPMGYLNPWIYQNPQAFTDVTLGTNAIGGFGYECTIGWDPATGLGTPKFDKMLAAARMENLMV